MNEIEKIFLESFCKACILIESRKRLPKDTFKKILNFVLNEMTYEESLMFCAFGETKILYEGRAEIDVQERIKKIEDNIRPWLSLSFSIAAGGPIMRSLVTGGNKVIKTASFGKLAGGGILTQMGAVMAMGAGVSFGLALLFKLINYFVMKRLSPCYKICNKRIPPTDKITKLQNKLCQANCRRNAYTQVINQLKNEKNNCKNTGNANKCLANINRAIAKYQDMAAKEDDQINDIKVKIAESNR